MVERVKKYELCPFENAGMVEKKEKKIGGKERFFLCYF